MSPIFKYHVKDTKGENKEGEIEALDEKDAINKLSAQELTIISLNIVMREERKLTMNKLSENKQVRSEMKASEIAIIALLLLILIVNIFLIGKPRPVKWEYLIGSSEDVNLEKDLKTAGDNGWEIAFARRAITGEGYSSRGIYEFLFKRPK